MKIKKFISSSGLEIWVGQDDYSNDQLSIKIAHANDMWFHVSGMPGSQLSAAGYGQFSPVKENTSPANKAENRRIEIVLQPKLDELPNLKSLFEK